MTEVGLKSLTYKVPGAPIPLARARHGQGGRCWDSQKRIKMAFGLAIRAQHTGRMFKGPLHLDVRFHMPIAASSKRQYNPDVAWYHVYTPDVDNLIKFVCDCAQSVLFENDCIIAKLTSEKIYAPEPCTIFTLTELG
jgi:Holliday junction resolvase RusA-like endonuclease